MTETRLAMPDEKGYFGEYGGQIIPPPLIEIMNQIDAAYNEVVRPRLFKMSCKNFMPIMSVVQALSISPDV